MNVLSAIYGRVAQLRRSWSEARPHARVQLTRPVISIGNLVVGGSGKTPIVAALARLLVEAGEHPAVLTRGYARRHAVDGVVVVSDGQRVLATVEQSGDEPQMLARALPGVPVLVSPDRYLAGRMAERRFNATVLLLDDGFQHFKLARNVDLLVAALQDLEERVLPAGRLREPLTGARAADAVLVYGTADDAEQVRRALGIAVAFTVRRRYAGIRAIGNGVAQRERGRVLALAGIAQPGRFFSAVRETGFETVGEMAFRDHHWFTPRDVSRIVERARSSNVDLILTTEKDAVRLEGLIAADAGVQWGVLPMEAIIEPADTFASWLWARLRQGFRLRASGASAGQVGGRARP